ncbi:MAG: peptidoglycan-binding protein [Sphingomonadales bacterium]
MLTIDTIRALYPRAPAANLAAFAEQAEDLLGRFGIGAQPIRLHYFLAQIGHESGGLTITQENLNYRAQRLCEVWPSRFPDLASAGRCAGNPELLANTVYGERMGNRGSASGDGWRYRGRGYIQITGRDGYQQVAERTGLDLEGSPDLAFAPEHALHVACGFWKWKGLNDICDTGNFGNVTRRINGGLNGQEDREAWLNKVRRILGGGVPLMEQPDAPDVIDIQRRLRELGYVEVGAADGDIGPNTRAAITRFRADQGLPPGVVDEKLIKALGLA